MDTGLLIRLFLAAGIIAAIFIFVLLVKIAKAKAPDKKQNQPDTGLNTQIASLEVQIHYLDNELKKAKASLVTAQEAYRLANSELEQLKEENAEFKEKAGSPAAAGEQETQVREAAEREQKKARIGEILLAQNLITEDILDKALDYQKRTGRSLTQYLLHYGHIDESQLAQCLCTQFGVPYLPLSSYDIHDDIIKLVPVDIAQKYWLMPVDKQRDSLMVVMIDPLDTKAIQEVEEVTGLKVIPFVGIISEIVAALGVHYKTFIKGNEPTTKRSLPFFIDTETYKGPERRRSVRFDAKIDVQFPVGGYYKKSQTRNVSRGGFSFDSDTDIPEGTILPLEVNLPHEISPLPVLAVIQVVRTVDLGPNKFEIDVQTVKIAKQELSAMIGYVSGHPESEIKP